MVNLDLHAEIRAVVARMRSRHEAGGGYEQALCRLSLDQSEQLLAIADDYEAKMWALLDAVEHLKRRAKWTLENKCGSSICTFGRREGQNTNGPCACFGGTAHAQAVRRLIGVADDIDAVGPGAEARLRQEVADLTDRLAEQEARGQRLRDAVFVQWAQRLSVSACNGIVVERAADDIEEAIHAYDMAGRSKKRST